jgi:hypothetical protein
MSFELVNTSVPKGLRDRIGWANVVETEGMPPGLDMVLEEMSGFDIDPRVTAADEIDWCHRIASLQGRAYTVLSRIAACGADWSGRPNRIAHHLVIDPKERPRAGPAWVLSRFDAFETGVPKVERRPSGPNVPPGDLAPRVPSSWERAGLDPGWAGVLASALLDGGGANTYLILPSLGNTLELLEDVFALVPPERRWTITFSTRFARVPPSTRCQLRCVREGAPGVPVLLAEPGCRKFAPRPGASAGDSPAAEAARSGREVQPSTRTAPPRIEPRRLDTPVHAIPAAAPRERSDPVSREEPVRPSGGRAWKASRLSQSGRPESWRSGVSPGPRAWSFLDFWLIIWGIACAASGAIILFRSWT